MQNEVAPTFFIKTFTIHTVEGASCVNIGNNRPTGFTSFKKHNQGFGSVSGSNNTIDGIKTLLNDESLLDMFRDSDTEELTWIKDVKDMVITKVIDYLEDTEVSDDTNMDEDHPIELDDDDFDLEILNDEEDEDEDEEEDDGEDEDYEELDEIEIRKQLSILTNLVSRIMNEIMPNGVQGGTFPGIPNQYHPGGTTEKISQLIQNLPPNFSPNNLENE
ncbi:hypothetical protein V7147_10610 [Bacillus sp. JJ1521]|uniref:hypothetical protein n=1 Tax=Bacillus sp. JJ1521 TaxID=3122957 RepID=UPI003000CFF4